MAGLHFLCRLQSGSKPELNAWKRICEASRKEFQKVYDRLGVDVTERGESFYNPMLRPLLEELQEKGIVEVAFSACALARCKGLHIILRTLNSSLRVRGLGGDPRRAFRV